MKKRRREGGMTHTLPYSGRPSTDDYGGLQNHHFAIKTSSQQKLVQMKIISTCSIQGVKLDEEQNICEVLKRAQSSLPLTLTSTEKRKEKKTLTTFNAFSKSYFIEIKID